MGQIKQNIPGHTRVRAGRRIVAVSDSELVGQAFMISCGGGVDSMAMMILIKNWGMRPDAVLFADTGGEKSETYTYIDEVIKPWLIKVGFPPLTIVHNKSKKYATLEENVRANETLPSLAFGKKSCSLKWKVAPMDTWTNQQPFAYKTWARGMKILKAIGYDASPADMKRFAVAPDDPKYDYWYPLREAGLVREDCKKIIVEEGLPVPMKSSCWFCPAMKREEVLWLAENHPDLAARAVAMEDGARNGKHGLTTTKGLGRNWSWGAYLKVRGPNAEKVSLKERIRRAREKSCGCGCG